MSDFTLFWVSFAIALSGAMAPGPLLTSVIYESLQRGFKAGTLIITGHAGLELALVVLLGGGLVKYLHQPLVLKFIFTAGALILIYLGARMMLTSPAVSINLNAASPKHEGLILTGITMSLASPTWVVWWLTVGLSLLLTSQKNGLNGMMSFYFGHILADFVWYGFLSLAVCSGRKFLTEAIYRKVIFFCGLVLVGFGVWFAGGMK